jgi:hypothetical protein
MADHDRSSTRHAQSSVARRMLASRIDLLSQMLDLLRLQGELVFSADLNHPWGLRFEPGPAYFFVVLEGSLIAQVGDAPRSWRLPVTWSCCLVASGIS